MVNNVPILLITWRRIEAVQSILDALRPYAPVRIFIASDGPRENYLDDQERIQLTREAIEAAIDWPCSIERLYSDNNLGCSYGPVRAINWFFDNVEEGIILEDDCIPSSDFYPYCASLLDYYRHDTRVWCIGGVNFQGGIQRGEASYYFSRYNHCWGWASWRRCWEHFDLNLAQWNKFRDSGLISSLFSSRRERLYWTRIWQRTFDRSVPVSWWDYQWTFACMVNGGLTVLPNANLVTNVGFDQEATHSHHGITSGIGLQYQSLGLDKSPLIHPQFVLPDKLADLYTFRHHFKGTYPRRIYNKFAAWRRAIFS